MSDEQKSESVGKIPLAVYNETGEGATQHDIN
jgi:hypothetical protein